MGARAPKGGVASRKHRGAGRLSIGPPGSGCVLSARHSCPTFWDHGRVLVVRPAILGILASSHPLGVDGWFCTAFIKHDATPWPPPLPPGFPCATRLKPHSATVHQSQSTPFVALPPMTACILTSNSAASPHRVAISCILLKSAKSKPTTPAVCRGPLLRAALTLDRLGRSNSAFDTRAVLQGDTALATGHCCNPGVLLLNRPRAPSRDPSQCSNY